MSGVSIPPNVPRIRLHSLLPAGFPHGPDSGVWGRELSVERGDAVLFTGRSGSGKTSLLSFLLGLRFDYAGSVDWGGPEVSSLGEGGRSEALAGLFAVVFQDLKLIEGFTARENVEVKRLLRPHRTAVEAERMAGRLGIRRVFDAPVQALSRGEKQRVAIIRALVQPFSFLFLDEPFSHLDRAAAGEAGALIEEERSSRGAGLLFFDLDDSSAPRTARRIGL